MSPFLFGYISYHLTGKEVYFDIGVLSFFLLLVLLTIVALVPTGSANPGKLEKIARYNYDYYTASAVTADTTLPLPLPLQISLPQPLSLPLPLDLPLSLPLPLPDQYDYYDQ